MTEVFELSDAGSNQREGMQFDSAPPKVGGTWVDQLRAEIDRYFDEMKRFQGYAPDEIFLLLSGWTARASEVRGQLNRSSKSVARQLITREIDPFIQECERQFRYHSRRHSVNDMEYKMMGRTT